MFLRSLVRQRFVLCSCVGLLWLSLLGGTVFSQTPPTGAAETPPPKRLVTDIEPPPVAPAAPVYRDQTNSREALEQSRQVFELDTRMRSDRLSEQLARLEHELEAQRKEKEQVLHLVESANQQNLLYAAMFISVVLVAVVALAFFQLRATSKLAELVASAASGRLQISNTPSPLETAMVQPLESQLLIRSVERLEQRIKELEGSTALRLPLTAGEAHIRIDPPKFDESATPTPAPALAPTPTPAPTRPTSPGTIAPEVEAALEKANARHLAPGSQAAQKLIEAHLAAADQNGASPVDGILGRGEAQLKLGHAEAALKSFEEALKLNEKNPDAWVKKGTALEKLERMEEAIVCYDRAIALDRNTTLAYLYKGGICNRLERFDEALACYEQALKSHEQPKTPS